MLQHQTRLQWLSDHMYETGPSGLRAARGWLVGVLLLIAVAGAIGIAFLLAEIV